MVRAGARSAARGDREEQTNGWHADHVYKHHPGAIEAFYLLVLLAFNLSLANSDFARLDNLQRAGAAARAWRGRFGA
jgi:hypothetical protein